MVPVAFILKMASGMYKAGFYDSGRFVYRKKSCRSLQFADIIYECIVATTQHYDSSVWIEDGGIDRLSKFMEYGSIVRIKEIQ